MTDISKTDLSMGNDRRLVGADRDSPTLAQTRDIEADLAEVVADALDGHLGGDPAQVAEAPAARFHEGGRADPGLMERVARKAGVDLGGNKLDLRPQPHQRDTSFHVNVTGFSNPRARPAFAGALVSNSVGLEDMLQAAQRGMNQLQLDKTVAENAIVALEKLLGQWTDHHAAISGEEHQRGEQIKFLRRSIREVQDQELASRRAAEDSVDH